MSARRWITAVELEEAKRLYHEQQLNWPDIGAILGRNPNVLARHLQHECKRPMAEVHRIKWDLCKKDGPRLLKSAEQARVYGKLRRLGYPMEYALEVARA